MKKLIYLSIAIILMSACEIKSSKRDGPFHFIIGIDNLYQDEMYIDADNLFYFNGEVCSLETYVNRSIERRELYETLQNSSNYRNVIDSILNIEGRVLVSDFQEVTNPKVYRTTYEFENSAKNRNRNCSK